MAIKSGGKSRLGMGCLVLFALPFAGVGFGLLIGGVIGMRKARAEAATARQRPEEPWLWKQEWATGRIRSSSKTLFFLIWSGAIALMICLEAPLLFPIAFGLFDLLICYWVIDLWLYRSVVDVTRHEVAVTAGVLGLGRTRRLPLSEIERIYADRGMQSGRTVFYSVFFGLGGGRKVLAGKRLKNRRQADAVIRELEEATGKVERSSQPPL